MTNVIMMFLMILGYIWALPHTVVGVLLSIFVYRAWGWHWNDGCLVAFGGTFERGGKEVTRIWGRPAAQTHGFLILYATQKLQGKAWLRIHERVHVEQALIGGPFYPLAYGLHFLWNYTFDSVGKYNRPRWKRAYYRIWFEKRAYKYHKEFQKGKHPDAWGSE